MQATISEQTTRMCEPWCVDHSDGDGVPSDAYCNSEVVTIAGIYMQLSNGTNDDTVRIFVRQSDDADDALGRDAAVAVARTLDMFVARLAS